MRLKKKCRTVNRVTSVTSDIASVFYDNLDSQLNIRSCFFEQEIKLKDYLFVITQLLACFLNFLMQKLLYYEPDIRSNLMCN